MPLIDIAQKKLDLYNKAHTKATNPSDRSKKESAKKKVAPVVNLILTFKSPQICVVASCYKEISQAVIIHLGDSTINVISQGDTVKTTLYLVQFDAHKCVIDAQVIVLL